jgi:hypothetical protein
MIKNDMVPKYMVFFNGQVILSLVYGDGYGVHGYIYVNCISVTGIELLLSAGMSIHFRSGNSSTRHDQFLAKVMPNFSVNSNSFSSSISASHHVVSRRVRGALQ